MRPMKRSAVLVIALAVATAVAAACAAGSPRKPAPTLTLASHDPVSVAGRHFAPRLKVRLVVSAAQRQVRRVIANRHGAFSVSFTTVIDRCSVWSVSAAQPGRAPVVVRGGAKPGCPPAGAA